MIKFHSEEQAGGYINFGLQMTPEVKCLEVKKQDFQLKKQHTSCFYISVLMIIG